MRRPIVTLTTDFGSRDHFVGTMKGVLLSICPEAHLVDISHEVQPFEVSEGAFLIAEAYKAFPKRTVHLVVVDPGVGSARRPILVQADGQYFVGPDNGVLAMVYQATSHKARAITAERYFRHPVSRTFHGRDVFAPVAAHLAKGVRPSLFGNVVEDHLKPLFMKPERIAKRTWVGSVLHIDRFGNMITNYHTSDFPDLQLRPFEISVGVQKLTRMALTFAEVDFGEAFVITGSSGYLEVAVNQGSAARVLGCGVGAPCELTLF